MSNDEQLDRDRELHRTQWHAPNLDDLLHRLHGHLFSAACSGVNTWPEFRDLCAMQGRSPESLSTKFYTKGGDR